MQTRISRIKLQLEYYIRIKMLLEYYLRIKVQLNQNQVETWTLHVYRWQSRNNLNTTVESRLNTAQESRCNLNMSNFKRSRLQHAYLRNYQEALYTLLKGRRMSCVKASHLRLTNSKFCVLCVGMNHFEAHPMIPSREVDFKVPRMAN